MAKKYDPNAYANLLVEYLPGVIQTEKESRHCATTRVTDQINQRRARQPLHLLDCGVGHRHGILPESAAGPEGRIALVELPVIQILAWPPQVADSGAFIGRCHLHDDRLDRRRIVGWKITSDPRRPIAFNIDSEPFAGRAAAQKSTHPLISQRNWQHAGFSGDGCSPFGRRLNQGTTGEQSSTKHRNRRSY